MPEFEHSRRTIRHVLKHGEPGPGPQTRNRTAPVLGPLHAIVDQILADDEKAPPKQRHTAMQMFRRLQDENGYQGCYGQVQRYVLLHDVAIKRPSFPWGIFQDNVSRPISATSTSTSPKARGSVPFLAATWAYSNAPFVLAMPFERTEAVLAGMVAAFEFFGCIPKEVWWDNPKTVATLILLGRQRQIHPRYAALASHYAFDPLFCMPARGNEKPDAESTVKAVQRRFATPVPRAAGLGSSIRLFASAVRPSMSEWFSRSSDHSRSVIASPKNKLRHRMFPISGGWASHRHRPPRSPAGLTPGVGIAPEDLGPFLELGHPGERSAKTECDAARGPPWSRICGSSGR